MTSINFDGAVVVGKPKNMVEEECSSVYARPSVTEFTMPDGSKINAVFFRMCLQPSLEDINAINAGQPIWMDIIAPQLTPFSVWTVDPNTGRENV